MADEQLRALKSEIDEVVTNRANSILNILLHELGKPSADA